MCVDFLHQNALLIITGALWTNKEILVRDVLQLSVNLDENGRLRYVPRACLLAPCPYVIWGCPKWTPIIIALYLACVPAMPLIASSPPWRWLCEILRLHVMSFCKSSLYKCTWTVHRPLAVHRESQPVRNVSTEDKCHW